MKRIFDLAVSLFLLVLLTPVLLLIALLIKCTSPGPVFHRQVRVGRDEKDFTIYKFRTMVVGSEKKGLLTVGGRDPRITHLGYTLRKFKLDEIPQLFNIVLGEMSLVGPRPEVRKYVNLYTPEQREVLSVRPGLTDYASIKYAKESDLLAAASDPEKEYIGKILPDKLSLNRKYINERNFFVDLQILFQTIRKVVISG